MSIRKPGLVCNYLAEVAVGKHLIVKFGSADGAIVPGAAAADSLIGVSTDVPADAGERCDVFRSGIVPVVYGGNVTKGDLLTCDANSKAVVASSGERIVGCAEVSGVANDIGSVCLSLGVA